MKSSKVSRVFTVLTAVSVALTIVSMFVLYVQAFNAPAPDPCAPCGPTPTLVYMSYGGVVGAFVFYLLAFLTSPRLRDIDSE